MGNQINVQKTGKNKWGGFYFLKEDKTFTGCSEAVSNFVKDKLPAVLEVLESETKDKGHETITKVRVVSSQAETKKTGNQMDPDVRLNVDSGNILQRATELVCAGKATSVQAAALELTAAFREVKKELSKGDDVEDQ